MNPQSTNPSDSLNEFHKCRQTVCPVRPEGSAGHTSADRMYQIAALTAGIVLLATLI